MSTNKALRSAILLLSVILLTFLGCDNIVDEALPPLQEESLEMASKNKLANTGLQLLYSFETFNSLGFSPDGITYSPQKDHLFISSAGPRDTGVFEVTSDGELVKWIDFESIDNCCQGYSITRASSGPKVGHFFLASIGDVGESPSFIHEFDKNWNWLGNFAIESDGFPGDGIAFNHISKNLVVADEILQELVELTSSGEILRTFPEPFVQGIAFNKATGTYFGTNVEGWLLEITPDGEVVREYNLKQDYGIGQPVGVASGKGMLFIADEIDSPNTGGFIHVFKSPKRLR